MHGRSVGPLTKIAQTGGMHPGAIALVVAAAVVHAGWNLCAKRVPEGGAVFVWLITAVSAALFVPVAVWGLVVSGVVLEPAWALVMGVSGALQVAYFLLLQRGYAVGDFSVVYPLARGSGPMLSVLAAVLFLGERPGALALVGAGVVVAGILVIGGLGSGSMTRSAGALYGLATGAVIAAYTLWDARAVTALAVPPIALLVGSGIFQFVLLSPLAVTRKAQLGRLWREQWPKVLTVAVLAQVAYLLVLFAMRLAPVSLVAPARELSIVFGSIAAWLILGEPNPRRRITGAVVVLIGVAAIAI
jgi:drug/metabolite transporter (DMT)-like permease